MSVALPDLLTRTSLRVAGCLLLAVMGFGESRAQERLTRAAFELAPGQIVADLQLVAPFSAGEEVELQGLSHTTSSASPTVEISEAFAKTFPAAGRNTLFVTFRATRPAGSAASDRLRFELDASYTVKEGSASLTARNGPQEPTKSVLAEGTIIKLAIDEDGIYEINPEFLSDIGLPNNGSPREVRLFSKGGAMLPEQVGVPYPVDLQEVALYEDGNGDDRWDGGERLLFYGQGEDVWTWNEREQDFRREENLYSERTHYYIKVGGEGKRVKAMPTVDVPSYASSYTQRVRWEEELQNLLYYSKSRYSGQGSGQDWFGPQLGTNRSVRRPALFDLGAIVEGAEGKLTARFAASATIPNTRFTLIANGDRFTSGTLSKGVRGDANASFASFTSVKSSVSLERPVVDIDVEYPGNAETALGWIDYVQITYPSPLAYRGEAFGFRSSLDTSSAGFGFSLAAAPPSLRVLDVSDPLTPRLVDAGVSGSGELRFGYVREGTGTPREFYAFDADAGYGRPENLGQVANTNLHAERAADMLIVYGEGLEAAALRLAEHRRAYNGYEVVVASMANVSEEFGGGRPDPTAIRALAVMLHQRDPTFKYLLLLGDGTFDPRGIQRAEGNLIPTYQTDASGNEVTAYPTDDYFALLDDGEGRSTSSLPEGGVDLGVGRIPATTLQQAMTVVDKVIRYETDPDLLGNWRLRTVFVADDEDNNRHFLDIEDIAERNLDTFPKFNQVKVYVDAYEQVPTTGGEKIPRAAEAINLNMFRGNLLTTYLGHGGPSGWGQERFLNAPDIQKWDSRNAYTVLVTATCTFTGFDDPERVVAGEQVLFKRDGGAVASLSTVRPVYISQNKALADSTHARLLNDSLARADGIGYLLALAKNSSGSVSNNRKYAMFGDPAMRLAVPALDVAVTSFDSLSVTDSIVSLPAVEALRPVNVGGIVTTPDGVLASDFDGEILVTVFDQVRVARTLGQDADSRSAPFDRQDNTLFTGRASVKAGRWTATFMLPKDMNTSRGRGRLSLYARSPDGRDAGGLFEGFIVDGLSPPATADDTPPVVELYIGDEDFVAGGLTGEDPVVYARLSDDTGINVSGASIGHDLAAQLRGLTEQNYVLNDFYQADKDDFTRGEVRYPIFDLAEGEYTLSVRAWDLANNTGTAETSFIVSDDPSLALRRVLNYPNPFVDATCFQFEHTAAGQFVEVQVDVYTSSGRRVKSLRHEGLAQGNRFGNSDCIAWDGTDDFGQRLARGVYLYKVSMRTEDGERSGTSDFERLVVLR